MLPSFPRHILAALSLTLGLASTAAAQCPPQGPLANYSGAGTTACPCFIAGEEAGVVLTAPAGDYPIEITKIRIGWGSIFGGAPQSLESALKIYPAGLPNPGAPQFTLAGPVLNDGAINEFDLTPWPGNKTILSGPFTVTLEFFNANAGMISSPSVVHDGNGCQPGKNVVKAIPGGWADACALGVSGDWVMEVIYEKRASALVVNGTGVNPMNYASLTPPALGTTWSTGLDCSAHAPSVATVLGHSQLLAVPLTFGFGELLVDTNSVFVFKRTKGHGGGVASFDFPLPNDPTFCGLTLYAQGACFGAPGVLASNALCLRIGD